MSELPSAMYSNGRTEDHVFHGEEHLYRRVPLICWQNKDDPIELDAIELPDMSVVRSKYAHPEWARFEGDEYKHFNWGVVGFATKDIPPQLIHLGTFSYTFKPVHDPKKKNYPHSEVRAYEDGVHIDVRSTLDHELHLRWREMLLRRLKKFIAPNQIVEIQQEAP